MIIKKILSAALAAAACMTMTASPIAGNYSMSTISAYASSYNADTSAQYTAEIARLVNEQRAANGLSALKLSDELCDAANVRATEIQSVFSHTRPNGTSCFTALKEIGISYTYAAENIAYGQKSPESVMNAWMNSSGHRANILNSKSEYIGIGISYKNGTYYWTQFFASGKGMSGETVEAAKPDDEKEIAENSEPEKNTTDITEPEKGTDTDDIVIPEKQSEDKAAPENETDDKSTPEKVTTDRKATIIPRVSRIICNKTQVCTNAFVCNIASAGNAVKNNSCNNSTDCSQTKYTCVNKIMSILKQINCKTCR